MRKYLYLAMAAASATVMAAPIVAQAAPAGPSPVLTISKPGGTAVKPGAALKASLAKGSKAVFTLGPITISCKSSSFTAIVISNPHAPGKATESISAESISKCTSNVPNLMISGVKALNLPYKSSVSDAKGFPVTVTGRKKSKPIELTATAKLGTTTFSCVYKAAKVAGKASNKGSTITITKQPFTKVSGAAACPGTASFSAKYGPVRDTSVKGNPAVFVN